jgi:hypothetical protein
MLSARSGVRSSPGCPRGDCAARLQARRNAVELKAALEKRDIRISWVTPIVVWVGDATESGQPGKLLLQEPRTEVWDISSVVEQADELLKARTSLSEEQVSRITELLRERAEAVR